jgi:hypothetical protein
VALLVAASLAATPAVAAAHHTLVFTVVNPRTTGTAGGYRFKATLDRHGKRAGSYTGRCTRSKTNVIRCHLAIKLARGTIHAKSVSRPPNHVASGPVTGGTRAYKGVSGRMHERGALGSDRLTVTLD